MKKLILVAALSLGSLSAFAQDTEEVKEEVQAQATEVMETEATEAVEAEAQDAFSAIELSELPAAVTEALAKDHPAATISKAYVNEEGQYKLEVAKEDGTEVDLYTDSEGNWLEM